MDPKKFVTGRGLHPITAPPIQPDPSSILTPGRDMMYREGNAKEAGNLEGYLHCVVVS